MSDTVYGLSVDAAVAEKRAYFWAEVLGRDAASGASPEFASIRTGPPRG
jgi:hypothetical protein